MVAFRYSDDCRTLWSIEGMRAKKNIRIMGPKLWIDFFHLIIPDAWEFVTFYSQRSFSRSWCGIYICNAIFGVIFQNRPEYTRLNFHDASGDSCTLIAGLARFRKSEEERWRTVYPECHLALMTKQFSKQPFMCTELPFPGPTGTSVRTVRFVISSGN